MRVVGEIPHPQYKITLFSWNGKYLLKFEAGPYEQTYKVSETEIAGDEALKKLVTSSFLDAVTTNFKAMHVALSNAIDKV